VDVVRKALEGNAEGMAGKSQVKMIAVVIGSEIGRLRIGPLRLVPQGRQATMHLLQLSPLRHCTQDRPRWT
jgi:hypothetical protein